MNKWVTIQLGSREHYAIPRVLETQGMLSGLLTDSWVRESWQPFTSKVSPALALRHHKGVPDEKVRSTTVSRVALDLSFRLRKFSIWNGIVRRNQWFQHWASSQIAGWSDDADTCFSYSYTARLPFKEAKRRGMCCILGQIDPGPLEQTIVDEETSQYADLQLDVESPPKHYWEEWLEELDLADCVLVNSPWSSEILIRQGVANEKIRIVPLAYEGEGVKLINTSHVDHPSSQGITALFLGQVILRKGVGQLFDAIRQMKDEAVSFIVAGPLGVKIPTDIAMNPKVQILGAVDRLRARELYRAADVFLLPTISDGFAITQLEAFAYGLPVIASKACGAVVSHGIDGLLLDKVTPESIIEALRTLSDDPELLGRLKAGVEVPSRFSLNALGDNLKNLRI